jgi:tetratricopeptide (TPR) repeat protein
VKTDHKQVDHYLEMNDPFGEEAFAVLNSLGGGKEFTEVLVALKKTDPNSPLVAEKTINQMGYELLAQKKNDSALEVFQLNTELYPKSGNACDSLAETYLGLGKKDLAKQYYQKALEVQPDYPNAKAARDILEKKLK